MTPVRVGRDHERVDGPSSAEREMPGLSARRCLGSAAIVLFTASLASCAAPQPPTSRIPAASPPPAGSVSIEGPGPRSEEHHPTWAEWRPSEPVRDFVPMPESEKMRVRADQLGELAKGYAIVDPPDIDLERWVRPDELLSTQGQCYREMGVEVVPDSRGFHMASEVSGLQTYICTARGLFKTPDLTRSTPATIGVSNKKRGPALR